MSERGGKRMAVFGKSGSGKTHFVKTMIADMSRVVVFDPEDEYDSLKGFQRVDSLQGLLEVLQDCCQGSFRVVFVPSPLREEAELHEVSRLIERMQAPYMAGGGEKVALVVDELNLSFPLNPRPQNDGFARLCSRGRKRGVNIIGVTQRPAEVATRFRGNLDRIAAFQLSLPNDWTVIRETMGPEAEEAVKGLEPYHSVFWEDGAWSPRPPVPRR